MSILNDLYYGRLRYDEKPVEAASEHDTLSRMAASMEKSICGELSDEGKKLFADYTQKIDRITDIEALESFTKGVQFALLLMAEALGAGGE